MSTVLVVQFGALRKTLVTGSLVLVGVVGLLVMHGLSFTDSTVDVPASSHFAMRADRKSRVMPARRDPSMPMESHLHRLLGCLWLVAAAMTFALAMGSRRRRGPGSLHSLRVALALGASQRAPPTSVRLSLVGISRR